LGKRPQRLRTILQRQPRSASPFLREKAPASCSRSDLAPLRDS
jgi:hypothetical protein